MGLRALKGGNVLNVWTGEFVAQDLWIQDGVILGPERPTHATDAGAQAFEVIDCTGRWIVPGWIDAHVHIESSCMAPGQFARSVLERGTTAAIADPHEAANVLGVPAIRAFLDAAEILATQNLFDLWIMAPSCVPATHLETNGAGVLAAAALGELRDHARMLGLAEVMNVPGILSGSSDLVAKRDLFWGCPIDGHAPGVRGQDLSKLARFGIETCHESMTLEEAQDKIEHGIKVWIREGSVARNARELSPLLTWKTRERVGFCTDDRNPLDLREGGHLDAALRIAIEGGVTPELAFCAASWSVAQHYGLDRSGGKRRHRIGALGPGFQADLVVLDDVRSIQIRRVMKAGLWTDEFATSGAADGFSAADQGFRQGHWNRFSVAALTPESLEGPTGLVNVIGVQPGQLWTDAWILDAQEPGVARIAVIDRYTARPRPAVGYVKGFGLGFKGALASTVAHDSHQLVVVGSDTQSMWMAVQRVMELKGGMVVCNQDQIMAELPLPVAGLISLEPAPIIADRLRELRRATHAIGCDLEEAFLQMGFLCLPVIPKLKITDRGLVDVERFELISVEARS